MKTRKFELVSATVFALVAALHALRLVLQIPVRFGQYDFPIWASWGGLAVAAILSIWGFRVSRR